MIAKTYQKYFFKSFSGLLIQVTLVFFCLIFILNIFEEINFFKDLDVSFYFPIFLTILSSPSILYEVFPFIFLISSQYFFIRLYEKNELNIFKYSGLTNYKILRFVSLLSFIIGIIIVLFFYTLSAKLKHIHLDIKNKYSNDNKYLAVITENGLWIRDEHNQKINIVSADKINQNFLTDVSIIQFDTNYEFLKRIDSNIIDISKKNWLIKNPKITESNLQSKNVKDFYFFSNFDYNKINSLFSNLTSLSLWELGRLKKDYKSLGYSTLEIESHIQKSISYPFYLGIMSLLSGIIMLNIKRNKSFTFNIIVGISLSVFIYYINYFSKVLGENEKLPMTISIWIPLLMLGLICLIGLVRINEK